MVNNTINEFRFVDTTDGTLNNRSTYYNNKKVFEISRLITPYVCNGIIEALIQASTTEDSLSGEDKYLFVSVLQLHKNTFFKDLPKLEPEFNFDIELNKINAFSLSDLNTDEITPGFREYTTSVTCQFYSCAIRHYDLINMCLTKSFNPEVLKKMVYLIKTINPPDIGASIKMNETINQGNINNDILHC